MLSLFGFGKKRKSSKKSTSKKSTSKKSTNNKRTNKKPPAKLLRLCKKLKIKVTIKRGGKRVYKKVTLLKKLCKRKMKLKKYRKVRKQRKSRFGELNNNRGEEEYDDILKMDIKMYYIPSNKPNTIFMPYFESRDIEKEKSVILTFIQDTDGHITQKPSGYIIPDHLMSSGGLINKRLGEIFYKKRLEIEAEKKQLRQIENKQLIREEAEKRAPKWYNRIF
jgi:hypothetical protein